MGDSKSIYVLMVTSMKTVMPALAPATIEGAVNASCTIDYFPAAASFDVGPLEAKGRAMKDRFPTVERWDIVKVPFMEGGRVMEYVFDMERCAVEGRCGEVPRVTMGMDARRERIVRCRDRENYRPAADEGHEDGCALAYANLFETSPDGFCAWGERRPE